ncbi:3-hydroxyacyl-CoA dehydrogenase NAD-binding domain-containing protein [Amycolatopsis acidiphila]|uniref:Hydroxylacyl-CoA dehydrogenase n=1 Tax=Amycolatopsis acidiphila TaxID=715473 RepID=A0A557ZQ70_9PSEU|nr:3-hydroxyacyl-CoA dehydrogenase NAD-binding domain-containing protein [Amycolatopsis acidiphila]TVT14164.1 hydroxylacyl-CoA dehydrogenase [Amycolatopsis acidiphila]UIJ59232.1 3-hydroxyacyl-CoA dehydrogenase NAD-binding domain-containing protein [Amycolatopsis acidiphila]GHG79270.1 hydroxylacyl-CoA dehydrogenase [Amycolatopsis acidiphila]
MKIAVIGAGTIGLSWTKLFADHGHDVRVSDPRADLADVLREFDPARVRAAADLADAVRDADVVQENGPENLEFKKDLFATLVEQAPRHALLLSSSSAIPAGAFAPADGERVLIGHPFNPPHVLPLVEVVPSERTSEDSVRRAVEFYRSLGRTPVVEHKEVPGFVGNRLQAALQREAVSLVQQGVVSPAELDAVVVNSLGPRWATVGPFLGAHLGGGPGGYRHLTSHIGSSMSNLSVGKPDTSPEATERVVEAVEQAYGDKSYEELAEARDRTQLAILSVTGEEK